MAFQNRTVSAHSFAMVPRSDVPRSAFPIQSRRTQSMDASYLVPIRCEMVFPGDSHNLRMTAFGRLATPIVPFMDNLFVTCFHFFCPMRLVWENWERFMGAQDDPDSSTDFIIPQIFSAVGGWPIGSLGDYFGLPTESVDTIGFQVQSSALPFRMYNLIWNEWFRDENLQDSLTVEIDDGPDDGSLYTMRRRGKRHDYFTSCLPFLQKGPSVPLPLAGILPVTATTPGIAPNFANASGVLGTLFATNATQNADFSAVAAGSGGAFFTNVSATGLEVDFDDGVLATINSLRQSVAIQQLLERDARGGTRYTEIVQAHFGVRSPDSRLQRPEYLGGGSTRIKISPIAQTGQSAEAPLGTLAAYGTTLQDSHGYSQSFVEHGYVISLACVHAPLTYQNGMRRHWMYATRDEFYFPVFANLGEQEVTYAEIMYSNILPPSDGNNRVFGYQERWAELRFDASEICGLMRSSAAQTIDIWHCAQNFVEATFTGLSSTFIEDGTKEVLERVLAVHEEANGQQLLMDFVFSGTKVRPLPKYSQPGLFRL